MCCINIDYFYEKLYCKQRKLIQYKFEIKYPHQLVDKDIINFYLFKTDNRLKGKIIYLAFPNIFFAEINGSSQERLS